MPYNNTPIAPPKEYTGTVSLPLARVKKIINADPDINGCSNNASFVIAVATEMFVQYLVERTYDVVKSERKPRRNIQYRDVANAVARIDNLEFLSDVVPRTQSYKSFKEGQSKRAAAATIAGPGARQVGKPEHDGAPAEAGSSSGLQQQQLNFGGYPQTNGQPLTSPGTGAVNGHARHSSSSHSRNHSLEHQNIMNPNPIAAPGPGPDAMQIDPPSYAPFASQPHSPEVLYQQSRVEAMMSGPPTQNGTMSPPGLPASGEFDGESGNSVFHNGTAPW